MTIAPTAEYQEFVLEVEFTSETWTKVAGLTDFTVSRSNNTDTAEVPDVTDESLPHYLKRAVRSQDLGISATGVWAITNHQSVMDWFYGGTTLNARVTNANVTANGSPGDTEAETIPMILTSLNNARQKGQVISAEIELQQNGEVTRGLVT